MYKLSTWLLQQLPPEIAHHTAVNLLRYLPVQSMITDIDTTKLQQELMGFRFPHPLGLAAGFDKDAEVFDKLGQLGFSFVEVGSITPQPQPGNPKPRLFRLPQQQAIINRYGFNSKGVIYAAQNLQRFPRTCITGINLGKNKNTVDDIEDFLKVASLLASQADYFTINVSSPNTPGLRNLLNPESLKPIITGVQAIIRQQQRSIPLLVKISPDMTVEQETLLIEFLAEQAIAGIIISNTTLSREGVIGLPFANEQGGLSGPPLATRTLAMLRQAYSITRGKILLIGCGGITCGKDAYEKLRAGANLLQIYTSFIYQGPDVIRRILLELNALLQRDGVRSISEITGLG